MLNKVKLKITGKNPNYFLEEIIKRQINIYYLEKNISELIIIISYSDYLELLNIKTSYKIEVIKRYGINKINYYFKRYLLLLLFIILGMLFDIILSNIIFNIEVIHPKEEVRKIVLRDLEELGIKKYHFKVNYQKRELIKEKLKKKEKDLIDWIEIEEEGTKYIIKLEEKKIKKEKKSCSPRNIIASKNALILDMKTISGESKKKKNDYVVKGETIISGIIYNKEDAVSKRCARGAIYGEVWYKVKVLIPKEKEVLAPTNSTKYVPVINFFNKKTRDFKKHSYNIIDSSFIPIKIGVRKYREVKVKRVEITLEEVDKKALSEASKKIECKLKNKEKILAKKVLKKRRKDSKIEVDVFIRVKENITAYQDISKINLEDLNKKKEE